MHKLGGKRLISLSCEKPAWIPTPWPGGQKHTFSKSQVGRRLVWVLWGALSALVPPSIGVRSPSAPHAPAVLHPQSGHSQVLRALSLLQGQRPQLSWSFAPHLCPGLPLTGRTRVLSLPLFLCPTHPSLVTSFQARRVVCASRLAGKARLPQLRYQERGVMVAGSLPSQACTSVLGTECPALLPPPPSLHPSQSPVSWQQCPQVFPPMPLRDAGPSYSQQPPLWPHRAAVCPVPAWPASVGPLCL